MHYSMRILSTFSLIKLFKTKDCLELEWNSEIFLLCWKEGYLINLQVRRVLIATMTNTYLSKLIKNRNLWLLRK